MDKKFLILMTTIPLLLTGCSSLWNWSGGERSGSSSSLVDYLYPDGEVPPDNGTFTNGPICCLPHWPRRLL